MITEVKPPWRSGFSAIRMDNCIITIGGLLLRMNNRPTNNRPMSTRAIWAYNLYAEEWRKHTISSRSRAPEGFHGAAAVAIERIIYIFGGEHIWTRSTSNELWKLSRNESGCFKWSCIRYQCKGKSPSPRDSHSTWEFTGKLWVFGSHGPSLQAYLNDHGDTRGTCNNQLLCYDPDTQKWANPQCFGAIPSPRTGHGSTTISYNVYLFGGFDEYLGPSR